MTSSELKLAEQAPTKSGHECVLLIAADADDASTVLGELGSVTEERFQVEWVTELSRGIERLRDGTNLRDRRASASPAIASACAAGHARSGLATGYALAAGHGTRLGRGAGYSG